MKRATGTLSAFLLLPTSRSGKCCLLGAHWLSPIVMIFFLLSPFLPFWRHTARQVASVDLLLCEECALSIIAYYRISASRGWSSGSSSAISTQRSCLVVCCRQAWGRHVAPTVGRWDCQSRNCLPLATWRLEKKPCRESHSHDRTTEPVPRHCITGSDRSDTRTWLDLQAEHRVTQAPQYRLLLLLLLLVRSLPKVASSANRCQLNDASKGLHF